MLKSELTKSIRKIPAALFRTLLLPAFLLTLPHAIAQSPGFTLTMNPFRPPAAIEPGGVDTTTVTLESTGFTGTVNLACAVSPPPPTGFTAPACQMSPSSVTLPGGASVNITSAGTDATGLYTISITGTSTTGSVTAQQDLSVLQVVPQFTIAVARAISPTSVPAGNTAVGTITISPTNGYVSPAGGIVLSCATISPLVTFPPVCSFNPQGANLTVSAGQSVSSSMSISVPGPETTGAVVRPRPLSALWLPIPMLALTGMSAMACGKKSRKAWGLLALFVVSGAFLLMPACGNTQQTTTTPNGTTPPGTYTFTLIGVDANGVASTNSGSGSSVPTVTLTVTAPTTN